MKKYILVYVSAVYMGVTAYASVQPPYDIGDSIHGKVWVVDGDSIRLTHANYTKSAIRIFAINAPEYNTDAGIQAKYFLIDTVKSGNRTATCHIIHIDPYKRFASMCTLHTNSGDIDIGLHMLQNHHATYFDTSTPLESIPAQLRETYREYREYK